MAKISKDEVTNNKIREMTVVREMTMVENIDESLQEQRLRRLGHENGINGERGPVTAVHFKLDGTKR